MPNTFIASPAASAASASQIAALLPQASQYTGTPSALRTLSDTSAALGSVTAPATALAAVTMPAFANPSGVAGNLVNIKKNILRQDIHGVGVALTDVSAWTVMTYMTKAQRTALWVYLFQTLGIKIVRVPMGSSDCNGYGTSNQGPGIYTYCDGAGAVNGAGGATDSTLATFSLGNDLLYMIPCMQEIMAAVPDVKFLFEPWSPPGWLKSNGAVLGGGAFTETTANFAILGQYFLKHCLAMRTYGINPWAYGVQNEADDAVGGTTFASCTYTAAGLLSATAAIRLAFDNAAIPVLVMGASVQYSGIASYSSTIASNAAAASIDIIGAHSYGGTPVQVEQARRQVSSKTWLHTEYCYNFSTRPYSLQDAFVNQVAAAIKMGASGYTWWNLAMPLPQKLSVYCNNLRPCLYVDPTSGAVTYLGELYAIAHVGLAAKPGAKRVECSSSNSSITALAFYNPDGSTGATIYNGTGASALVSVQDGPAGQLTTRQMDSGELITVTYGASNAASIATSTLTPPAAPTLAQPTSSGAAITIGITPASLMGSTALSSGLMYRSTAQGAETLLGAIPPGATSYADSTATAGTLYYYYAKSQGGGGLSTTSNEVTGQLILPPTSVSGSAAPGNGQNVISLSGYANGAAITQFNIFAGTSPGGEATTAIASVTPSSSPTTGTTTATYTHSGLTNGTEEYYTIQAVTSAGNVTSAEFNGTPSAGVGPLLALTIASVSPTPGVAFSSALTGLTSGTTRSAVSSDGTSVPIDANGNLTGTWAQTLSGTNPTITVTETQGPYSRVTTFKFAVAAVYTPALLNPFSRVRFDQGVTSSSGAVSKVTDIGTISSGSFTATGTLGTDATNSQAEITFNGTSNALVGAAAELSTTSGAPGMWIFAVVRPAAAVTASRLISFDSENTGGGTRAALLITASNASPATVFGAICRTTDAQSSAAGAYGATTVISGTQYIVQAELNLPAGTAEVRTNGAVDGSGTGVTVGSAFPSTAAAFSNIGSGWSGSSPPGWMNGEIQEVIRGRGVLTAAQKYMNEGYGAWRYGQTLPSAHPFYSYPPTVLGLSVTTATHGAAFSAQITGLPPGATSVTASLSTSDTGFSITNGVLSGTFATTETCTITLSATYNGVTLTGSVTVLVS